LWLVIGLAAFAVLGFVKLPVGKESTSLWAMWGSLLEADATSMLDYVAGLLLFWTVVIGAFGSLLGWLGQALVGAIIAAGQLEPAVNGGRTGA
jgi:hypothetical protein